MPEEDLFECLINYLRQKMFLPNNLKADIESIYLNSTKELPRQLNAALIRAEVIRMLHNKGYHPMHKIAQCVEEVTAHCLLENKEISLQPIYELSLTKLKTSYY